MIARPVPALAAFCLLAFAPVLAEEGMWMPRQVPDLAGQLADKGYKVDTKSFSNLAGSPMGAVVSLGGCSASFVSPDGLIITNHHCVRSALQYNATPERDLLKDGFLAKTRGDELPAGPGTRASITVSMTDVTDEIIGKIDPALSDRERYEVIERRSKERVAKCEKGGLRCRVASFFEGNRYFEIAQQELSDVRLVYAPHSGIGRFGGETDNWRWPRHTGDYAFYRAYVAPDGSNVTYAKANVPYHPKHWLKIDTTGVDPGETVVVTGYPGNTRRLDTFQEIKRMAEWTLPRSIKRAEEQIAILDELGKRDAETAIKVHNRVAGLNNGLTNNRGKLQGLLSSKLLDSKAAREKALAAWIAADAKRQKEYGEVLPALDALTAEENKTRLRDAVLSASETGSSVLSSATTIYRLSLDRPKADLEREPAYQERNWKRIREREERAQRTLDAGVDRAIFRYNLLEVAKLPEGSRLGAVDRAAGLRVGMTDPEAATAIDAFLDKLYAGTRMFDKDFRLSLLDKSTADVLATKDPFVDLAVAMYPESHDVEERKKAQEGLRSRLAPTYIKALLESSGGLLAPDANGTLRVTFGRVEGVAEKDGLVYLPQTTLAGIVEKNQGKGDFDAPAREIDAIAATKGKALPVNFLASVDTTGGNSGSPAFNAKGELVGLLFDGTFDTVGSDVVFDPVRTRSILVDIRYVLWVMGEVDGATALLTEMGIR
ncbi:MAG TPA: S46 family peptidase [Candidatus Bathyarchaeia archaeon]|nr:S46 family peptidase [Candidatus Bathyarchaeia archaeon]